MYDDSTPCPLQKVYLAVLLIKNLLDINFHHPAKCPSFFYHLDVNFSLKANRFQRGTFSKTHPEKSLQCHFYNRSTKTVQNCSTLHTKRGAVPDGQRCWLPPAPEWAFAFAGRTFLSSFCFFCLDNEKKVLFTSNSALFFIYITVCFCFVSALNKKRREVIRTLVLFRNFSGNKQQPKITCLKLEIDVSLRNRQINT